MRDVFCIDNYSDMSYRMTVGKFAPLYAKHMGCSKVDIYSVEHNKDALRVVMCHQNPLLTPESFKTKVVDYFNFLRSEANPHHSEDNMLQWIRMDDLSKKLEMLPEEKTSPSRPKL